MVASALLDAGFILVVGVLYVLVALRLARRRSAVEGGNLALGMFQLWWWGVAGLFLLAGTSVALRAAGHAETATHVTLAAVGMLSVCAGLAGLASYVLFVFAGRAQLMVPLVFYYSMAYVVLVYGLSADLGEAQRWAGSVSSLTILTGPIVTTGIFIFLAPVLVACVFYASLYARVQSREQKLRVGLTSLAFVAWFGSAIAASVTGVATRSWWPPLGQAIGVFASLLVLLSYWPPRWLADPPRRWARAAR